MQLTVRQVIAQVAVGNAMSDQWVKGVTNEPINKARRPWLQSAMHPRHAGTGRAEENNPEFCKRMSGLYALQKIVTDGSNLMMNSAAGGTARS